MAFLNGSIPVSKLSVIKRFFLKFIYDIVFSQNNNAKINVAGMIMHGLF
jgi:hypothetical protein